MTKQTSAPIYQQNDVHLSWKILYLHNTDTLLEKFCRQKDNANSKSLNDRSNVTRVPEDGSNLIYHVYINTSSGQNDNTRVKS